MGLRSGDKHHLRKSLDRKAQIRKALDQPSGLICALRSADFLRWCRCSRVRVRRVVLSIATKMVSAPPVRDIVYFRVVSRCLRPS